MAEESEPLDLKILNIGDLPAGSQGFIGGDKIERSPEGAWYVRARRWWSTTERVGPMRWETQEAIRFEVRDDGRLDLYIPHGYNARYRLKVNRRDAYLPVATIHEQDFLTAEYHLVSSDGDARTGGTRIEKNPRIDRTALQMKRLAVQHRSDRVLSHYDRWMERPCRSRLVRYAGLLATAVGVDCAGTVLLHSLGRSLAFRGVMSLAEVSVITAAYLAEQPAIGATMDRRWRRFAERRPKAAATIGPRAGFVVKDWFAVPVLLAGMATFYAALYSGATSSAAGAAVAAAGLAVAGAEGSVVTSLSRSRNHPKAAAERAQRSTGAAARATSALKTAERGTPGL